jgi:general secretion pathway protein E
VPHAEASKPSLRQSPAPPIHVGPLDWRSLVEWLRADGVIAAEEEPAHHRALLAGRKRPAPAGAPGQCGHARASDGKPLDIEMLTQWLAGAPGLDYLRIDPLKVDVGKVADTMSAAYAERHKVLPVQVTPRRWWWPRPSPS